MKNNNTSAHNSGLGNRNFTNFSFEQLTIRMERLQSEIRSIKEEISLISKEDIIGNESPFNHDSQKLFLVGSEKNWKTDGCVFHINDNPVRLTSREANCLYFLIQGKTAKEIGKILKISNRTVEVYINQLRFKTKSKSRVALLNKFNRLELEAFMKKAPFNSCK